MNLSSPWLPYYRPRPPARLRLFCFPFAGGGASLYNRWAEGVPAGVEVCAVQLPGRENRLAETPLPSIEAMVGEAADSLGPFLDRPFAMFGHSMGARIGFELARRLRDREGLRCAHLFTSASRAPHIPRDARPIHHLAEREFAEELRRLDGIPDAVLRDPELRSLFMPVLRADFKAVETYTFEPGTPLSCPITSFGGEQDRQVRPEHLEAWGVHTERDATIRVVPGDHFYLQPQRALLLDHVSRALGPLVGSAR